MPKHLYIWALGSHTGRALWYPKLFSVCHGIRALRSWSHCSPSAVLPTSSRGRVLVQPLFFKVIWSLTLVWVLSGVASKGLLVAYEIWWRHHHLGGILVGFFLSIILCLGVAKGLRSHCKFLTEIVQFRGIRFDFFLRFLSWLHFLFSGCDGGHY